MAEKPSHWIGLPKEARILAHDISIRIRMFDDGDKFGHWIARDMLLELSLDHPSKTAAVDTLLHEMTHAIWSIYGIEKTDTEERIVTVMGAAWTQVWRDNPKLLAWVAKALKD